MITIYYPRIDLVTLNTLREPARMNLSSRSGLSIDDYKNLIIDIESAIKLIESIPADYMVYITNKENINMSIDDFNRQMYLKWSKK